MPNVNTKHATENQGEAIGYGQQYEVFPALGVDLVKNIFKKRQNDPHANRLLLYFGTPWLNHESTGVQRKFLKEHGLPKFLSLLKAMPTNFFIVLNLIDSYMTLYRPTKAIQLIKKFHRLFQKWIPMETADLRAIAQGYYLIISRIFKYDDLKDKMENEIKGYCETAMKIHPTSLRWKEEALCINDKLFNRREMGKRRRKKKHKHRNKTNNKKMDSHKPSRKQQEEKKETTTDL